MKTMRLLAVTRVSFLCCGSNAKLSSRNSGSVLFSFERITFLVAELCTLALTFLDVISKPLFLNPWGIKKEPKKSGAVQLPQLSLEGDLQMEPSRTCWWKSPSVLAPPTAVGKHCSANEKNLGVLSEMKGRKGEWTRTQHLWTLSHLREWDLSFLSFPHILWWQPLRKGPPTGCD